jgi:CheY-like chemotaxis protein
VAANRPFRILLVEDNVQTLQLMDRILRKSGHQVTPAATASHALKIAQDKQFDLLISDIGLPDLSGWELMERLRAEGPLRGIAISGFVSNADRERSLACGFLCHLAKPIKMKELEDAIRAATVDLRTQA